jgi:DNA-directed RNA polymerase II subunit RPB11
LLLFGAMADDNLPDRFESIVLPEGVKKLRYVPDTRLPNCASFVIEREDHTLANALRAQLLRDRNVLFAAYRVPHPLEHHVILKVQTRRSEYTPLEALCAALVALKNEIHVLEDEFANELQNWAAVRKAGIDAGNAAWLT